MCPATVRISEKMGFGRQAPFVTTEKGKRKEERRLGQRCFDLNVWLVLLYKLCQRFGTRLLPFGGTGFSLLMESVESTYLRSNDT